MKLLAIFIGASAVALAPATLVAQNTPAPEPAAEAEAPQSASAMGTVGSGPDRRFTGADLFDLATASDPQISPDGAQIAYVRRSNDVMSDSARSAIWLVDARTGEEKPLAGQDGNAFSPRWAPSGDRLAFVSTNGGSAQLWVRWMDGGEAVRLTGLPTSPSSMAWSPDGRSIAYTMLVKDDAPKLGAAPENKPEGAEWAEPLQIYDLLTYRADGAGYLKPGFEKIFVIPADGGAPRQLTFGPSHDGGPLSWSRDGSTIYFGANRKADWQSDPVESEIYAVDLASGGVSQLTDRDGPDHSPRVSPNGSRIAYLGYDDALRAYENDDLYVMDTDGSNRRILTESWDFSPTGLEWDADGRAIYAQYDVSGETRVARIGLDGSIRDVATGLSGGGLDRPYTGGSFSVAKTDAIASTGGPATRPAELRLTRDASRRTSPDPRRRHPHPDRPQPVFARSEDDGRGAQDHHRVQL